MITKAVWKIEILPNLLFLKKKIQDSSSAFASIALRLGLAAFLILSFGFNIEVQAQDNIEVTGQVVDSQDGVPLPGVNVIVKGMPTRGTATDENGEYSLTVPSAQDTLVFSFIGYVTQEIPVNGRSAINVQLARDVQALEDVVVVGYGTQERQQITGSVSSIEAEDFISGNISDPALLIQGQVPGLVIATAGGDPNGDPTIRLRGITSFSGSQEPLVVIDGVIGGDLDNVNPNDIASIDVLKDASASAIYGTRGAAGVIVVTTKKGTAFANPEEAFSVSYNGYFAVEGVANKLDVLSANEFVEIGGTDLGGNVNYFDAIAQTGYSNVHSLSLSGGNQHSTYRISGNFRNQRGIQIGTSFEEINGRLNLTQSALDDKLDITFNLAVTNQRSNYGFGQAFRYAATFNPTAPIEAPGFENTGGYQEILAFDIFNPVAILETSINEGEKTLFAGFGKIAYDFRDLLPGLTAYAYYSLQVNNRFNQSFYAKTNKWRGGATQASLGPGEARRYVDRNRDQIFEGVINYQQSFQDLQLETIAGYSYSDFVEAGTWATGGDFISDAVTFNNFSFAQDFSQGEGVVGSYKNLHKIIGFFGRASLNWNDTYFLNGSIRREGSSRFGINNKWGTFWAAGLGVEVTNLVDLPVFSQFKVRASYGVSGNDAPFDGISKLRFAPQGNFFVNGRFIQSFGPVSNANPDLKWEENHEYNIGIDFEAFDARLSGTAEYYVKNTQDLLFEVQVPVPPNLYPTTWKNIGELQNKGFEAMLNYTVFRDTDLFWETGVTFSTFNTVLTEFVSGDELFVSNAGSPGLNSTPLIRVKEGEPIGQIWGPEFAGISPDGDWLFYDYDKDGNRIGKLTPDELTREDEKVLGNGLPDFSMGWTNRFNYKNFDLSMFVRGVFGHDMVNTYRLFYQTPSSVSTWNVLQSTYALTGLTAGPKFSSFFVEDASFVKLQNVTIGYTLPANTIPQIRNLRVFLSGNNLFTLTGYDGIDPQVNYLDPGSSDSGGNIDQTGNALAPGIERRNGWFTTRTVTLGIQVDF